MIATFLAACAASTADTAKPDDTGSGDDSRATDDSGTDDTGPTVDTAACVQVPGEPAECAAATRGEYLDGCLWDHWGDDLLLTGEFTAFGREAVTFLADDGTSYDFGGGSEEVWDDLPDLESAGTVDVLVAGGCGAYGEGTAGLLVEDPGGDLLLLVGRGPGPWTIGAWSASRVDAGCGERESEPWSCTACEAPQPLRVSGPAALEAWPGTPVDADGYGLVVGFSYDGRVYECADGPGEEFAAWYVVPR